MERPAAAVQGNSFLAQNTAGLKPLRIGVIGLGVGAQHAIAYANHPGCRVTMLCDLSKEKRAEIGAQHPESAQTDSVDDILKNPDIDLVSIASFDHDHFAMVKTALEQGKHVFVEKPLCQTADQLRALHRAWKQHKGKVKLASNLVLRTAPLYRWLKEQLQSGSLGEIYAFDTEYLYGRVEKITDGWRRDVENYSAMQGGGIHMADLLLWLTGQRPARISTQGNQIATRGSPFRYNDYMAATLECPSGLVARITANFGCMHRHQHVLRIFGTKGTFFYDDAGARLHTSRDPSTTPTLLTHAPKPATKGELIREFVDAIRNDASIDNETQSHFDVMSVLIASDQSLAAHTPQEINYL